MIVCVLPAGLPAAPGPSIAGQPCRALELRAPFGAGAEQFLRSLALHTDSAAGPGERTWVFEVGDVFGRVLAPAAGGPTVLSFDALGPVRERFLRRLNIIEKDLHSADQAFNELRRLDLAPLLPVALRRDPRMGGFVRDLFFSGNGALLFGNSFVEWGASEAMRRAQPQLLVCSFGIRRKMKPFSSVAVFEDQERANPAPELDDAPSSLVDTRILAEYVYLTTLRLPAYAERTLGVFVTAGRSTVLLVGPSHTVDWPSGPLPLSDLSAAVVRWLEDAA